MKYILMIIFSYILLQANIEYKSHIDRKLFIDTNPSFYTINLATLQHFDGYTEFSNILEKDNNLFIFEFQNNDEILTKVLMGSFEKYDDALSTLVKLPKRLIINNKPYIDTIGKFQDIYKTYHPKKNILNDTLKNEEIELPQIQQEIKTVNFLNSFDEILKEHPQILEQISILKTEEANKNEAIGNFLPSVNYSYDKSITTDSYRKVADASAPVEYTKHELSANWNLFNGFSDYNNYKQYEIKYLATKYSTQQAIDDIILKFILAYIDIIKQKESLALSKNNLDDNKLYMEKQKLKSEYGMTSLSESIKLKNRYLTTKLNYKENQKKYFDSLYMLQRYVNIERNSIMLDTSLEFELTYKTLQEALDQLQSINPYILESKQNILVSKGQLNKEYKNFLPTLDLRVARSKKEDFINSNTTDIVNETTILLQGKINLFNGGKDYNKINSKLQEYKQKQNKSQSVIQETQYNVKVAWQKYETTKLKLEFIKKNYLNSQKAYEAAKHDFNFAKIDINGLQSVLDDLYSSQLKLTNQKYDLLISKYEIVKAIGNLQEIIQNRMGE